jgi:putative tryptophan/tyrosine transport system substrate-binding protein
VRGQDGASGGRGRASHRWLNFTPEASPLLSRGALDLIRRAPHHPGMDRRRLLLTSLAGVIAAPLAAGAQQAKKVPRIGILSPPEPLTSIDVFQRELRDLGYPESDGIRLEYRLSAGQDNRFPALAGEIVDLKVDVIIAVTVPAIRAAQRATTTIPIVMILSSDPLRLGLVKSLARPGGNTTGVASLTFDLAPKRLEVFKQAVPHLRQVAVLVNPTNPAVREGLSQTEAAARTLGVAVQGFEIQQPTDFEIVFAAILRGRPDGLLVVPDPLTSAYMARIVDFAAKNRLPAMNGRRQFPESGGLTAYGIDYVDHVRAGVRYFDKILKGAKAADLPVEQPTKFELVINLKTAKALGLTIPPSLLARADQVIE